MGYEVYNEWLEGIRSRHLSRYWIENVHAYLILVLVLTVDQATLAETSPFGSLMALDVDWAKNHAPRFHFLHRAWNLTVF